MGFLKRCEISANLKNKEEATKRIDLLIQKNKEELTNEIKRIKEMEQPQPDSKDQIFRNKLGDMTPKEFQKTKEKGIKFHKNLYNDYEKLFHEVKENEMEIPFINYILYARQGSQEDQLKKFQKLSPILKKIMNKYKMMHPFGVNTVMHHWANLINKQGSQ